jgi:hypothetical protein
MKLRHIGVREVRDEELAIPEGRAMARLMLG